MNENNKVLIDGEIGADFEFSHEVYGEKFYSSYLKVERKSGVIDEVPIIISERLFDCKHNLTGLLVSVKGVFCSYNKYEGDKRKLVLYVFVKEIEEIDAIADFNNVELEGFVCKQPSYRLTPQKREIADMILAVNRPFGRSDYIPCILWGRNAKYVSMLQAGAKLKVFGRIQSREYTKIYEDGTMESKIAYELSVDRFTELGDGTIEENRD